MIILKGKLYLRRWFKQRRTSRLKGLIDELLEQEERLIGRHDLLYRVRAIRLLLERARVVSQIEVEDVSDQLDRIQAMQSAVELQKQFGGRDPDSDMQTRLNVLECEARQVIEDFRP